MCATPSGSGAQRAYSTVEINVGPESVGRFQNIDEADVQYFRNQFDEDSFKNEYKEQYGIYSPHCKYLEDRSLSRHSTGNGGEERPEQVSSDSAVDRGRQIVSGGGPMTVRTEIGITPDGLKSGQRGGDQKGSKSKMARKLDWDDESVEYFQEGLRKGRGAVFKPRKDLSIERAWVIQSSKGSNQSEDAMWDAIQKVCDDK